MKQNKNIDKFIKEGLEVEHISMDFSDRVLQQIYALDKDKEKTLTSLLQKHTLQEPSINFTSNILSKIQLNSKTSVYQPVISAKAWYIILSGITLFVFYVFFYFRDTSSQSNFISTNLVKWESLFSFNLPPILTSPLFALSMFALCSLLFLDYFLQKRKTTS